MSNKTKIVKTGLIGLSGAAAAAVAAGVVVALTAVPMPGYIGTAPSLTLSPAEGTISVVCPGALNVLSGQPGTSGFYAPGEAQIQSEPQESSLISDPLDVENSVSNSDHGYALSLADQAADKSLSVSQFELSQTEELAGAAAAVCTSPSNDFWLVGGSTEVGRTSLMVLSNPSDVAATVTLETFDEHGYVEQQAEPILVQPHQQTLVSLAGYLPESIAPVVRVQSVGGQITALMQQSTMRTLAPSGVDWVAPSTMPATDSIITGVALSGVSEHDRSEVGDVVSDLEPTLRIVAPGEKDSSVTVVITNDKGNKEQYTAKLKARQVAQLPLAVAKDGLYSVQIHAKVPVVAGIRTIQDFDPAAKAQLNSPGGDFTWIPANAPLPEEVTVPIPQSLESFISLFNASTKTASVTLTDEQGKELTQNIAPNETAMIPVTQASNYKLTGVKGLYGTVVFQGNGLGSAMAIVPSEGASSAVTVYPR